MKKLILTMALACLLGVLSMEGQLDAGSPYGQAVPPSAAPMPTYGAPAVIAAPPINPAPAGPMVVPAPGPGVSCPSCEQGVSCPSCENCAPQTKKVCVYEETPKTKRVFSSHCKDYCCRYCTCCWWNSLKGGKCNDCEGGECATCGKPKKRNVLVFKYVDDCPTKTCVVKEVPVDSCPSGHCGAVVVEHSPVGSAPMPVVTMPENLPHMPAAH